MFETKDSSESPISTGIKFVTRYDPFYPIKINGKSRFLKRIQLEKK